MAKSIKVALDLDTRNFDRNIKSANKELNNLEGNLSKSSTNASSMGLSMGTVATALAGVAAAAYGLSSAVNAARSVEDLGVTLETLYGSAEVAAEAMQIVQAEAAQLTFELQDIQSGVPALALVEEKFGGLDNAIQATAGIASAFGMSFQEAATNVQRALSAGIGAADLFRDKGVKAFLGFQEGVEYTAEETQKLFLEAFDEITAANEKAADTLTGQFSMVGDAAFQVQAALGEAFGETLKTLLEELNTSFSENRESILETAKVIGETLGSALLVVIENADILASLFIGMFAAAAVGRVAAFVGVLIQVVNAIRAAATAGAAFQAILGPAGWASLAAGAVAAGASMIALNALFDDTAQLTTDAIDNIGSLEDAETEQANNRRERVQETLDNIVIVNEEEKKLDEERQKRQEKDLLRAEEKFRQAEIGLEYQLKDLELAQERIGLTDVEIELLETTNDLNRERDELLAEIGKYILDDEERNRLLEETNELYDENIEKIQEQIIATAESQRKFSTGWTEAWTKYAEDASNYAQTAHDVFNTFAQGMEDAFVKFLTTGKLSFKDLIDSMYKEIARFIAKQAVKKFLGIIGAAIGGPLGALLTAVGGGLAGGGPASANIPYIVGEEGPELFVPKVPGYVIPNRQSMDFLSRAEAGMGGGGITNVNYTIYANDAKSFREMIARDKEFIYNVTVAGGRSLPR